jgi:cytochrome c biogenesis protein
MSAVEETIRAREAFKPKAPPVLNRMLDFLSSVRLGVVLLCVLVVFAMVGMLIMQQNVQGFDAYYASLTPAERMVYGSLGLFDIYHGWYFNLILLVLSLNIVLASIDRFPSAWSYISRPKTYGSHKWLAGRKQSETIPVCVSDEGVAAEAVAGIFRANRLKTKVTTQHGVTYVFGESGKWNRMGAYIVHVALLTLFMGHFVALQTGFDADVRMIPGEVTESH